MNIPKLIGLNGLAAVILGAIAFLYPAAVTGIYAVPAEFEVYALIRFLGVVMLAFGALLLWAGSVVTSDNVESLARALMIGHGIAALLLFIQYLAIWNSMAGLVTVIVFAVFAVAYAVQPRTPAPRVQAGPTV